jgi:hypothetical protein
MCVLFFLQLSLSFVHAFLHVSVLFFFQLLLQFFACFLSHDHSSFPFGLVSATINDYDISIFIKKYFDVVQALPRGSSTSTQVKFVRMDTYMDWIGLHVHIKKLLFLTCHRWLLWVVSSIIMASLDPQLLTIVEPIKQYLYH